MIPVLRALLLLPLIILTACNLPKDPEGTEERVRGGTLNVGVLGDELGEADRNAMEAVARGFDAEIVLIKEDPHMLADGLQKGTVDIVFGDIPEDTVLSEEMGLTRAYGTVSLGGREKGRVAGVRMGENGFLVEVERLLPEGGT